MSYLTKKHISKTFPMILKFNVSSCKFSLVFHVGYSVRLMTCLIDDTGWSLWAEILMLLVEQQLLSSYPLEGKNSIKRHSRVSSSRGFLGKAKAYCRGRRTGSLETRSSPTVRVGFIFSEWWKLLCVLCHLIDKLIDGLRLYTFSPCGKALTINTEARPRGQGVGGGWRWGGGPQDNPCK